MRRKAKWGAERHRNVHYRQQRGRVVATEGQREAVLSAGRIIGLLTTANKMTSRCLSIFVERSSRNKLCHKQFGDTCACQDSANISATPIQKKTHSNPKCVLIVAKITGAKVWPDPPGVLVMNGTRQYKTAGAGFSLHQDRWPNIGQDGSIQCPEASPPRWSGTLTSL